MKKVIRVIFFISVFSNCTNRKNNTHEELPEVKIDTINYCQMLEYLKFIHFNDTFIEGTNDIVPILERKTDISSNASKGYAGYQYFEDSIFIQDYNLWKKKLGCN